MLTRRVVSFEVLKAQGFRLNSYPRLVLAMKHNDMILNIKTSCVILT